MSDKTPDILFDYLYKILYKPEHAPLDATALPPEYQKLAAGLQALDGMVAEERSFALALSHGDLSATPPGADNILAAPGKNLQSSLRHLAWQTQQVAKGDYSQRVDFMGEFSTAFNTMTVQLEERYNSLAEEKRKVEEKNAELSRSLELVSALTQHTHNMTFVLAAETGRVLFSNDAANWMLQIYPAEGQTLCRILAEHHHEGDNENWDFSIDLPDKTGLNYYGVESFTINWSGENADVYILNDETERRQQEDLMYRLSYSDPLTGLNNRRYATNQMAEWRKKGTPFLLSFLDIDHLKYCNDTYGHSTGDRYLIQMATALRTLGGELCRVGGDEFILLERGTDAAAQNARLDALRTKLLATHDTPYPACFSYATTAVPAGVDTDGKDRDGKDLDYYISATDEAMYAYKRVHKPTLGVAYRDERLT